jgi:hypothetical protein
LNKKLVIHIGLRKAGSSTIQQFLNENEQELNALGCDYPRAGRRSRWSHLNIAAEIRGLSQYDAEYGGVEELKTYLESQEFPFTVISSEVFEPASRNSIQQLKNMLSPLFSETEILLIARDPQGLIPSSYAEGVASGRKTMDFDSLFDQLISMRRLNYFLTARRWALVWGWKSIRVRLLDRQHMINGDLADDFMSTIGLDLSDPLYKALKKSAAANVSPGWRVIEALRAFYGGKHALPNDHSLLKIPHELSNIRLLRSCAEVLGGTMGWNMDRGSYVTRSQAELCEKVYFEAIEELNGRLTTKVPLPASLAVKGFKEREFLPDAQLIDKGELREFYDALGEIYVLKAKLAVDQNAQSDLYPLPS